MPPIDQIRNPHIREIVLLSYFIYSISIKLFKIS